MRANVFARISVCLTADAGNSERTRIQTLESAMISLRNIAKGLLLVAMLFAFAGCSVETHLTKDEEAHIKGHAPPPDIQRAIAAQMAKGAERMHAESHAPAGASGSQGKGQ
jgi:hypothetical protein